MNAGSTGFKAPTPAQSNASNTSTELSGGMLVNNGTISATNPVALAYGSASLKTEVATSFTFGAYMALGQFDVAPDFFDIDVEDRLNLSNEVNLSAADIAQLVADGVPGAGDLTTFRFLARVSFYDEWFDSFENDVFGTDAVFSSEYLVDLEVAYDIYEHASILVGGYNVFDNSGAFWYGRIQYNM